MSQGILGLVLSIESNFRSRYTVIKDRAKELYNSEDPVLLWYTFLRKYSLIPGGKDHGLKNWLIIAYLTINTIRYLYLLTVKDKDSFVMFGSVFYPFGVGGVVIYIAAAMTSLESLVCRCFLYRQEKGLAFFVIPNGEDLNPLSREKFLKRAKAAYYLTKTAFTSTNYSSNLITLLSTIYCISKESDWLLKLLWFFWFVCQAMVTYTATHIFIILGLWFIQKDYLDQELQELVSSVNQEHQTRFGKKGFSMNYVSAKYTRIRQKVSDFNKVSKVIIFMLTFCSTAVNTSLIYGAMKTQHAIFQFLSVMLSVTSLYPLWVATSLSLESRDLSKELLRRRHQTYSVKSFMQIRNILKNCLQSLSLKTLDGHFYEPRLFCNYVVSSVSMFLMLVDFVEGR